MIYLEGDPPEAGKQICALVYIDSEGHHCNIAIGLDRHALETLTIEEMTERFFAPMREILRLKVLGVGECLRREVAAIEAKLGHPIPDEINPYKIHLASQSGQT